MKILQIDHHQMSSTCKLIMGHKSLNQFDVWITDCGFPSTGSFSTRQLRQLKGKLEQKEKESHEEHDKMSKKKQKNHVMFAGDWKAYACWLEEANRRERKTKAGTGLTDVSQCLKYTRLSSAKTTSNNHKIHLPHNSRTKNRERLEEVGKICIQRH